MAGPDWPIAFCFSGTEPPIIDAGLGSEELIEIAQFNRQSSSSPWQTITELL